MYRISSFLLMLAALGFGFAACEQNPNTTTASGNFMDQPMKPPPATTPADPKIVYITADGNIAVMDSTGGNQTTVYTPTGGFLTAIEPNWSPANSITWTEYPSAGTSQIRVADISVSNGIPVSSNIRTIASASLTSSPYMSIGNARWSSQTYTNKIAFSLDAPAEGSNHICLISASGGSWDTIYTAAQNVQVIGLAWNWDDTKLAAHLRQTDESGNFVSNSFIVIATGLNGGNDLPGTVLESIPVNMELPYPNEPFDWSRNIGTGDINKLVFVADTKIYYLSAQSGATPTTNNVSGVWAGSATWSPSNTSVMFVTNGGTRRNSTNDLVKNVAQTTTVSTLDSDFPHSFSMMNWHR